MATTEFYTNSGEVIALIRIDRKKLPCVETEGTVLCDHCGESYEIEKKQKLHSIVVTECPHCGHQNISVVTNSIKFINEVLDEIERLKNELLKMRESLEIELQQDSFVDNYPEAFTADDVVTPKPRFIL